MPGWIFSAPVAFHATPSAQAVCSRCLIGLEAAISARQLGCVAKPVLQLPGRGEPVHLWAARVAAPGPHASSLALEGLEVPQHDRIPGEQCPECLPVAVADHAPAH